MNAIISELFFTHCFNFKQQNGRRIRKNRPTMEVGKCNKNIPKFRQGKAIDIYYYECTSLSVTTVS